MKMAGLGGKLHHRAFPTNLFVVGLLLLCACAEQREPDLFDPLSLEAFPIRGPVADALAVSLRQLPRGVNSSPIINRALEAELLAQDIQRPETRLSAADTLLARLGRRPADLFLLDQLIRLGEELGEIPGSSLLLERPVFQDTSRALGLYAQARGGRPGSDGFFLFLQARLRQNELEPAQRLLLTRSIARELRRSQLQASALELLLSRLASARRQGGPALEAGFWRDIADCLLPQNRRDEALHALRHADRLFTHSGLDLRAQHCLLDMATIFAQLGQTGRAFTLLRQVDEFATEFSFPSLGMDALKRVAGLYESLDEVQTALHTNQEILGRSWASRDPLATSLCRLDIAGNYLALGFPDSAQAALNRARRETERSRDPALLRPLYLGEADFWLYSGNYQAADSLRRLAGNLENGGEDIEDEITRLFRLARYGRETGRPETAQYALDELGRLKDGIFLSDPGFDPLFEIDIETARLKLEIGEFELARDHLEAAGERLRVTPAASKATVYWHMRGLLDYHSGDLFSALASLDSALHHAKQSRRPALLSRQHQLRGRIRLETGDVQGALEEFEAVGHHLDRGFGHRTLQERELMLGLCARQQGDTDEAVAIFSRVLRSGGDTIARDLAIRLFLERAKGLERLGETGRAYEDILEACRLLVDAQLAGGGGSLRLIRSKVLKDAYLTRIRLIIGNPHLLLGRSPARESLKLRQEMQDLAWGQLPSSEPLDLRNYCAAYLLDKEEGYLWFMRQEQVWFFIIPGTATILPEMETLLHSVSHPGRPLAKRSAGRLAEYLLGPLHDIWPVAKRLRILPDDTLYGLPWVLLPWEGGTLLDHASLTLTGDIRAPSFRREVFPTRDESLLSIGFNGETFGNMRALRYAEAEAAGIAELWPGEKTLLLGRDARSDLLRRAGGRDWNTIHLAVHAEAHQGLSELAYLSMATAEEDASLLTARDIARLDLKSELVFLSCCEASRDSRSGSGAMLDLSRAFIEAGSHSVLASTRRIDDRSAWDFATRLYTHRLNGKQVAEALRLTQKEFRDEASRWSHPYYWAHYLVLSSTR